MTRTEAREAINAWANEEYGNSSSRESDRKIGIAYSEYESDDLEVFVTEQWYADIVHCKLYCELNGEVCITKQYSSLGALILNLDFDYLIGEADNYIREHIDSFKEA